MRHFSLGVLTLLVLIVVVGFLVASQMDLSAQPEPGPHETRLATATKHWLIGKAARNSAPPEPPSAAFDPENGGMLYGMDCDSCHGKDGRHPTSTGQWMYPRVLDLGSPEVQGWSDAELFWIVKNGVRYSGMPAFGKVQSDKEIWDLVHYVRLLGGKATTSK